MTTRTVDLGRPRAISSDRALTLVVLALGAAAWLAVALTHGTSLDHHAPGGLSAEHGAGHENGAAVAMLVLGGWTLMVLAMMLPPALPLLQTLRGLVIRRRHRAVLLVFGTAGFVGVWMVVGVLLIVGQSVLHPVLENQYLADRAPQLVTGVVLAAAGLYQFTPLKRACLRACRSPRSFALAHWRGRRPAAVELVTVSISYAVSCVGCCWALMVISLAVGTAVLPVMVILAVVMAAERLVTWGRRLITPVGLVLITLGVATALGLLPIASS